MREEQSSPSGKAQSSRCLYAPRIRGRLNQSKHALEGAGDEPSQMVQAWQTQPVRQVRVQHYALFMLMTDLSQTPTCATPPHAGQTMSR